MRVWRSFRLVVCGLSLLLGGSQVSARVLESPADGAFVSGVGFISGWKCNAGNITVRLDGGGHIPLATEQPRADTRLACGTVDNGFITQVNWNHLGAGTHTAVAYDDGVEFARSTFTVGSPDEEFLKGVEAECRVPDFPALGENGRFVWNESTQHLELAEAGRHVRLPDPPVCPTPPDPDPPAANPLRHFDGRWNARFRYTYPGCAFPDFSLTFQIANGYASGSYQDQGRQWTYSMVVAPSGAIEGTSGTGGYLITAASGRLRGRSGSGRWFNAFECGGTWTATKQ